MLVLAHNTSKYVCFATVKYFPLDFVMEVHASSMQEDLETTHTLLELAARDDPQGFKDFVQEFSPNLNAAAPWYHRHYASHKMGWLMVTPAMIASLYGSLEVLKFILSYVTSSGGSVSTTCGADEGTALHYAVAGGSSRVLETVRLLLSYGADVSAVDAHGMRPCDVMMTTKQWHGKVEMEKLLTNGVVDCKLPSLQFMLNQPLLNVGKGVDDIWRLQSLDDNNSRMPIAHSSSTEAMYTISSPSMLVTTTNQEVIERTKEHSMEANFSDVKNSIYTSDDFRMFSFKVRPCSRAYSHDWTECPFAHTGENARRRDPRKFHYSCVPCPDFRKGACRFGDACEYAHGIFESWLHPAQYRTRLCKDGVDCTRRVCFFAHTKDELRPLYISSGSAVPSPRGPASYDVSASLGPGSPSSFCMTASLFPPLQSSVQASNPMPTMSPNSLKGSWASPSVPPLNLPSVGSLHASRLRTALNARDGSLEDWGRADGNLKNDSALLSPQTRFNMDPAAKFDGINISPISLDNAYAMEIVSPPSSPLQEHMQSHVSPHLQPPTPPRSRSLLQGQLHSRAQMLSPGGSSLHCASMALLQAQEETYVQSSIPSFYSVGSPRDMMYVENEVISHVNDKKLTRPINVGTSHSRGYSLADWGSPTGKLEWGVQKEDLCRLRRSSSVGLNAREGPTMYAAAHNMCTVEAGCNVSNDEPDSVRGFWLEEMQPDEIVA